MGRPGAFIPLTSVYRVVSFNNIFRDDLVAIAFILPSNKQAIKALYMENNSTQQEVLLMTGTKFASRQPAEKDTIGNFNLTGNEKLKDACWNGLLKEMLPELFEMNSGAEDIYLWQVREANQFFALEMSEFPMEVDKYLSIDPYRFMGVQEFN